MVNLEYVVEGARCTTCIPFKVFDDMAKLLSGRIVAFKELPQRMLSELSPLERLVCVWWRLGFPTRQIAHTTGMSPAAVHRLYTRVAGKLKRVPPNTSGENNE